MLGRRMNAKPCRLLFVVPNSSGHLPAAEADNLSSLRGQLLNALPSVAVSPGGLRLCPHPSSKPKLVEERLLPPGSKRTGWFLTGARREAIRGYGMDEG